MDSPPLTYWPDDTLTAEIHCALGVRKRLEYLAREGMLALPRTGLGVGGFLIRRREGRRISVTDSREISCSHVEGPSFALNEEELATAAGSQTEVVGWYWSKTRGSEVTPSDRKLFDALCPEFWQIALMIRPKRGAATEAAFVLRAGGGVLIGTTRELVPVEEETVQDPPDEPLHITVGEAEPEPEPEPEVQEPPVPAPEPVSSEPVIKAPEVKLPPPAPQTTLPPNPVQAAPQPEIPKFIATAAPAPAALKKKKKKHAPLPPPTFMDRAVARVVAVLARLFG